MNIVSKKIKMKGKCRVVKMKKSSIECSFVWRRCSLRRRGLWWTRGRGRVRTQRRYVKRARVSFGFTHVLSTPPTVIYLPIL